MVLKKILFIVFLGASLFIFSCENTFDLDLLDNPNFPATDNANMEAQYASVQVNFAQFLQGDLTQTTVFGANDLTMQLSRQRAFTAGNDYANAFTPDNFNEMWRDAYSDFFPDAQATIANSDEFGFPFEAGTARILQAYTLMTLVDLFGDVPFTQINQGSANIAPERDSGESIYAAAEALLRQGIEDLSSEDVTTTAADNFFEGDVDGWINAAYSLLIKLYVTTNSVNPSAVDSMMSIVNNPDYTPTNFYFNYTSNRANPDSRHPFYEDSYETVDGDYQSNWFMWALVEEKGMEDPRARSYLYRQVGEVPLDNPNQFDCVFSPIPNPSATPDHYLDCDPNMPYCVGSLDQGYYGRDHGNGNGIPPDGDIRTVYGVYPGGGKFDANTFQDILNNGTDGGLGAGVIPVMPANFITFYRAEAALTMGTGEDARALLEQAVRESIANVLDFAQDTDPSSLSEVVVSLPGGDIFGFDFLPSDSVINLYVSEVLNLYDTPGADQLDVVMKEFLLASYGNGIEGYNMLRRTGRPLNIQPMIQPTAGSFIRSNIYPAVHVNLNENASQRSAVTEQVFWDTNPADFVK